MKDSMSNLSRVVIGGLFAMTVAACAAESSKSAPRSPAAESAPSGNYAAPPGYPQPGGYPAQAQPGMAPPPAPPPPPQPGVPAGTPGTRSVALQNAANEVEASQRELDVAAGDCRNACRALGSMDRAAGEVCRLTQSEGSEGQRCDNAKKRVYSARDRVKTTCGTCPGGVSVDRADPIPSSR